MTTKDILLKKRKLILFSTIIILDILVMVFLGISIYTLSPSRLKTVYLSEDERSGNSDGFITVGVCQVGSESVWRTANTASIKKALSRQNGFFLRFSNARQKQENQIKTVREYISQKVDVIVIAPVTAYGWDTVLAEAKEAGIPVIITDRRIVTEDETLYTAFVGTNMYEEGLRAGQWLEQDLKAKAKKEAQGNDESGVMDGYLDESGTSGIADVSEDVDDDEIDLPQKNIVILRGTEESTAQIDRSAGFAYIADNHPEWNIVADIDADFTTTKAEEVMRKILWDYDDIDVIVSQNDDMTFGAINALDKRWITHGPNGDVTIISFDAVREALLLVRDGEIDVDIECNPVQGEMLATVIKAVVHNRDYDKINYIDDSVFTRDNVNAYINTRLY